MRNNWDVSQHENRIYFFAAFASICLSIWLYSRVDIINPDGICYLLSAQAMSALGFTQAIHICNQASWPLYSLLIYGLSSISNISSLLSAYIIDTVFSLLTVIAFLLIVKQLGGNKRTLALSALTILFAHQFNSVRDNIIRDHGFWAFYLLSLLFMLHFYAKPYVLTALAWSTSLLIATCFRIEGAVFLVLLPFMIFFNRAIPLKQRIGHFISLNLISVIVCSVLATWVLLHSSIKVTELGRLSEITTGIKPHIVDMIQRFAVLKASMARYVIPNFSAADVSGILVFVMAGWYITNVIGALSWIYFALVIYGFYSIRMHSRVLYAYLGVNLVITFAFLFENLFLSKRYLIAMSLVLMLWVPFALNDLMNKANNLKRRTVFYVIVACMLISACGGIFNFGYSKQFIADAGEWLATHSSQQTSIYVNDYQLMYYSGHYGFDIFTKARDYNQLSVIRNQQWKQFDLLALRINDNNINDVAAFIQEAQLSPIKIFSNKHGDRVAIYKIRKRGRRK